MEKVFPWTCILLVGFLLTAVPSQGLECFKCFLENNPNCVDNYPSKDIEKEDEKELLEPCQSYDVGCIYYDYLLRVSDDPKAKSQRMGGQRCLCKAEKECLEKQGVKLETAMGMQVEMEQQVKVSWMDYQSCMDNYNKLPGGSKTGMLLPPNTTIPDPGMNTTGMARFGMGNEKTKLTIFYCVEDGCNRKGTAKAGADKPLGGVFNLGMMMMILVIASISFD